MKRFYNTVRVETRPPAAGFAVMLDRRTLRTPARKPLHVPNAALAHAIAGEWDAQGDVVAPALMPLTQLAATALDRVSPDAASYARSVAAFGATDLVCYRAEGPQSLVKRQAQAWQPLVEWAADTLSAPLTVTGGVAPVAQPPASLAALYDAVASHDSFELAALGLAATASGSVVIALALSRGRIDAGGAFAAGFLDEAWQVEQWGADEDAQAREANVRRDIETAARFLALRRRP